MKKYMLVWIVAIFIVSITDAVMYGLWPDAFSINSNEENLLLSVMVLIVVGLSDIMEKLEEMK